MKIKIILVTLIAGISVLVIDFIRVKKKVINLEAQYQFCQNGGESLSSEINRFFFITGMFPDSLSQLNIKQDTMIQYPCSKDPFSNQSFQYVPLYDSVVKGPSGYYLISAGIDGRFNYSGNLIQSNKLFSDSLRFSYWDYYFGRKDLILSSATAQSWLQEAQNLNVTLKELQVSYKPDDRRNRYLFRPLTFSGVVENIYSDYFIVRDTLTLIAGKCYPSVFTKSEVVNIGDAIDIRGIYCSTIIQSDTVFVFSSCLLKTK